MASERLGYTRVDTLPTRGSPAGFADSLSIWINKPHVVNRRLCGSKIISMATHSSSDFKVQSFKEDLRYLGYEFNDTTAFCTDEKQMREEVGNENVMTNGSSEGTEPSDQSKEWAQIQVDHESENSGDVSERVDSSLNKVTGVGTEVDITESDGGDKAVEREGNENHDKHASDGITQVEGLADYGEDVVVLIVRELVPKQPDRHRNIPELVIYEKTRHIQKCTFYPISRLGCHRNGETHRKIEVIYQFSYSSSLEKEGTTETSMSQDTDASITLSVNCPSFTEDSSRKLSLTWLQGQLLPKIARWSEEPNLKTSLTSLKLVPLEEYNALYNELKIKYGQDFAKIWPEKTDPQKYVYEDVAIATYLLLLWKHDRKKKGLVKKQSFIDLGCGNGLLVHILSAEGHSGYGVDVRKRNIWDLYGSETSLKERPITPSRDCLFPDSDWLIGNHSDELTPWIPVMAARSSYTCCYFVLPCCHYDFDCKFSQSVVGGSQYREYLNYIQSVGENSGFVVEEDMLRIPSTKRVCFVGRSRSYVEADEDLFDEKRTEFINSRCNQSKTPTDNPVITSAENGSKGDKWSADFEPRSRVETTRNCVTVRQETKEVVIRSVFKKLLSCDTCEMRQLEGGKTWRKGGVLPLSDVVKLFDSDLLQELKSECGGIQTLLRNSSQIFQVTSGMVQLRDFTQEDPWGRKHKGKKSDNSDNIKTSLCWFNTNHPDGCPRSSELCDYAHTMEELRTRPTKMKKLR